MRHGSLTHRYPRRVVVAVAEHGWPQGLSVIVDDCEGSNRGGRGDMRTRVWPTEASQCMLVAPFDGIGSMDSVNHYSYYLASLMRWCLTGRTTKSSTRSRTCASTLLRGGLLSHYSWPTSTEMNLIDRWMSSRRIH